MVLNPFVSSGARPPLASLAEQASYSWREYRRPDQLPATQLWLASSLRRFAPDVLHTHLVHAELCVAALPAPRRPRRILTHHHGDHFVAGGRRLSATLDRWAGTRFDRVVAVSRYVYDFLRNHYRYPAEKLEQISNGWAGAPRESPGHASEPTIVTVARLRPQKGHAVLLDAFTRVREEIPNARLRLVGDGPLAEELQRQAAALGITDSVEFAGTSLDVWSELEQAHVFALASHYEPQGIAVLEAMAAGLPVVATAVGGIPELIEPGRTGELVPPNDPVALANELVRLLSSPSRCEVYGQEGRREAAGYTVDKAVTGYFDLYERVIAER
jgi:glycosyltransferase involved in cell wall biosynthesis